MDNSPSLPSQVKLRVIKTDNHTFPMTSLEQNDTGNSSVAVVMVPLPAQGHLNQLLHLSRLIVSYNIPVHFVGSTTHTRQAKTRVHGWDPLSVTNMNFHEFPTPPFNNPPPNPNAIHKFPSQILPSLRASTELRDPVYKLVQELSVRSKRVVVIHDSMMAYVVQDIGMLENAEAYSFQSIAAFSLFSFLWELTGKPVLPTEAEIVQQVPSIEGCFAPEFFEVSKLLQEDVKNVSSGNIYNTSRVIEGLYLDLLAKESSIGIGMQWGMGPFNPVVVTQKHDEKDRNICLKWLDKHEKNSVVFVSFGTTSSIPDDQIYQLALGLEKSEQKFIWVLRDADKGDIFEGDIRRASLPEGFEERIEEQGLIIRDWAPQLEILRHESTGAFISHCGWNSSMESISMGVPIGAWPMHSDQPKNAFLVTKVLRTGLEVRDWEQRDEVLSSSEVEKAVRRLMASEEGDAIRERAGEIGEAVRSSVMEGGVSHKELNEFITHINR